MFAIASPPLKDPDGPGNRATVTGSVSDASESQVMVIVPPELGSLVTWRLETAFAAAENASTAA